MFARPLAKMALFETKSAISPMFAWFLVEFYPDFGRALVTLVWAQKKHGILWQNKGERITTSNAVCFVDPPYTNRDCPFDTKCEVEQLRAPSSSQPPLKHPNISDHCFWSFPSPEAQTMVWVSWSGLSSHNKDEHFFFQKHWGRHLDEPAASRFTFPVHTICKTFPVPLPERLLARTKSGPGWN